MATNIVALIPEVSSLGQCINETGLGSGTLSRPNFGRDFKSAFTNWSSVPVTWMATVKPPTEAWHANAEIGWIPASFNACIIS